MTTGELTALHVAQWFEVAGFFIAAIFCIWYGIIIEWRDWFSLHVMSFVAVIAILLGLSSAQFFWPSLVTHASFVYFSVVIVCLLTATLAWRLFELYHATRHKNLE